MKITMKKLIITILSILLVFGLVGCSGEVTPLQDSKRIVSIATVQPKSHPISIGLEAMGDYLSDKLGESYEVQVYYNGIMGGNTQAIELLQLGTLNIVATSGSNLEAFDNTYKIFGVPYLFKDEVSFRKVMEDEEFINPIYNSTIDNGIQGVAWFANGVNNIYSTKPIYTPDDLNGLKFRIQPSEANVMMAEAFGAGATVMAYGEVYTALQNKVIDAASNPEMALVSMNHGEVAPYYSRTEHQIFTDMLIANVDFLNDLSEKERVIFNEAFKVANKVQVEEWDKQIEECIEQAIEMGVKFIEVDKDAFEELQKPVKEKLLAMTPEIELLYEKVQEIQKGE